MGQRVRWSNRCGQVFYGSLFRELDQRPDFEDSSVIHGALKPSITGNRYPSW